MIPILASLALPLPLTAQTDVVARATIEDPLSVRETDLVEPHPAGGVVALSYGFGFLPLFPDRVDVRHIDGNGDVVWSTRLDAGAPGTMFETARLAVGPGGEVAVTLDFAGAFGANQAPYAHLVDPTGQPRWTVQLLSPPQTSAFLQVTGLGFSAAGDVLLGGSIDSLFAPPFSGVATVRSLDAATGAELWRYERTTDGFAGAWCGPAGSYIGYRRAAGDSVVERLDDQGQVVYSTPSPVPLASGGGETRVLDVDGTGAALVLQDDSLEEGYAALDGSGAVLWASVGVEATRNTVGVLDAAGGAVVTSPEDAAFLPWAATRFAPDGSLAWQAPLDPGVFAYGAGLLLLDGGSVGLVGASTPAASGSTEPLFLVLDSAGATTELVPLEQGTAADGAAAAACFDGRGNPWVAASFDGVGGGRGTGRAYRLVRGGDPSAAECVPTQPNSTGALSRLRAAGSAAAADDNLTLVADRLPAGETVLFLNADQAGLLANPGGSQGTLCLGGTIGRFVAPGQVRAADAGGRASLLLDLTRIPRGAAFQPAVAGQTLFFQAWHRDALAGAPTSNLTGSIRVDFQ